MKKNVLVLVLVFIIIFSSDLFSLTTNGSSYSSSKQTTREIILKGRIGRFEQQIDPQPPTAYVEDNLITVSFNQAIEDEYVFISIRSEFGEILYETTVAVNQATEIYIPVDIDDSEEYVIEISSTEIELVGEF
jgi:septal ring-binding cell division protein DamX